MTCLNRCMLNVSPPSVSAEPFTGVPTTPGHDGLTTFDVPALTPVFKESHDGSPLPCYCGAGPKPLII